MSYLVDANVLSEATRPSPDSGVLDWLRQHNEELYISVVTIGELQRGIALYPEGRKRSHLEKWFNELVSSFNDRILPFDQEVAIVWGKYYAAQQRAGRKPPSLDSLLAATAQAHELTIVTRNVVDFPDIPVLNPWTMKKPSA